MIKITSAKEIVEKEITENTKYSENMRASFIRTSWDKIVGKQLSLKSEPYYIKNSILYIKVEGSGWIQQMNFYKKDIILKSNEILNGFYIKGIFFINRNVNENKIEKNEVIEEEEKIDISKISLKNEELFAIKTVISKIEDSDLKKKFYKLMIKEKKKETYLLNNGYKKCQNCGVMHNEKESNCFLCSMDKKTEKEREIASFIMNNLYATKEEIISNFQSSGEKTIETVKNRLLSRIYSKMCLLYKENKKEKAYQEAEKYFAISTGIKNRDMILKKIEMFFKSFT